MFLPRNFRESRRPRRPMPNRGQIGGPRPGIMPGPIRNAPPPRRMPSPSWPLPPDTRMPSPMPPDTRMPRLPRQPSPRQIPLPPDMRLPRIPGRGRIPRMPDKGRIPRIPGRGRIPRIPVPRVPDVPRPRGERRPERPRGQESMFEALRRKMQELQLQTQEEQAAQDPRMDLPMPPDEPMYDFPERDMWDEQDREGGILDLLRSIEQNQPRRRESPLPPQQFMRMLGMGMR